MISSQEVDVVIATRDTREITLRSVRAAVEDDGRDGLAVRCVLVDNASADGTPDVVEERFARVRVIRNEADQGFGRACNQGARAGRAEYLLVMNSDVFARPGAIARLVRFLAADHGLVAASGRLVDVGTDRPQAGFAMRGYPTLAGQLALLLGLERLWPSNPISSSLLLLDFAYERTQDVDAQPAGACLLVRRADYEAVGGFDESFHYWFEDVDFLRRLSTRGRIAYCHEATFEHIGGASFAHWSRPQVVQARYHGLLTYFEKHHARSEVIALRVAIAVLAAARAAVLWPVAPARARAYGAVLARALSLRSRSRGPDG